MPTVNHATGESTKETRNVLEESARISRGQIRDIRELNPEAFDAVIFPGGYGAAKNLCTFAQDGTRMKVRADVEDVILAFKEARKPIGMC